jgi:predicted metal-binding membrane protein
MNILTIRAKTMASTRRFPGAMLSALPVASLSRWGRALILACIALITVLAWVYLVHLVRQMSSEMEHDKMMAAMGMTMDMRWTATDVFFTFAMWVVMMVGMMGPAAAPVILLFAAAQAKSRARVATLTTVMFGVGYVGVWTGFSAGAALAQWALHEAAMLSTAMAASNPHLAGLVLIAAGAFQLTPWKSKCLTHCRNPLGFLMTNWRDGKLGALQMRLRHGAYCLGCSWASMCVLFVVGVMNLV